MLGSRDRTHAASEMRISEADLEQNPVHSWPRVALELQKTNKINMEALC